MRRQPRLAGGSKQASARSFRAAGALDWSLRGIAAAVLLSTIAGALHDVSQAWDVWYYHLPFAARIAGIVPARAFVFHAANQARFEGFPLLAEAAQGALWRVTGRPESANLVAFASVPVLVAFMRRRFAVPWHASALALMAIPLVQTHATSCYIDLPANAAASVVILLAIGAYATREPVRPATLALACVAAAVAANTKVLLQPIVIVALAALGWRAAVAARSRRRAGVVVALALALPIVLATPIKNAVVHHNPYYPVRLSLLGHSFPGTEDPYADSPPWLAHAPRPARFACSLLEIGVRPMSDPRRWTVDQWMPEDSTGNRMGGFFGAYVVFELGVLVWAAWQDRTGVARRAAMGFAVLTAATSVMPQSHELRYYMEWMLVLVALDLWLIGRARPGGVRALAAASAVVLIVVVAVTRAAFVLPSGSTFAELLRHKVDARVLATVHDGEHVCVERAPYDLLWASTFHPPKRYVVKEAEEPGECGGYRPLD